MLNHRNYSILAICIFVILQSSTAAALDAEPVGWASPNAHDSNGTTGGAGGETVILTTADDLKYYMNSTGDEPYIILVQGIIDFGTSQKSVKPNKSIIGIGPNPTIIGGFRLKTVHNVIIRNLIIKDSNYDGISVEYDTHHVWVDHCELTNGTDGLLDITHACDYVTVSWNRFSNHSKTCLLGHADDNGDEDIGHLKVTYHHNWFDGTSGRHPRVRFSYLTHVFNNYYYDNSYGIASTCDAEVLVEGCYFWSVGSPTLVGYGSSWDGDLVERYNIFAGCGSYETRGTVPEPCEYYPYTLDLAADVPAIVTAGAGLFPEEYDEPPVPNAMTWFAAPNAVSPSEITMTASTAYDYSGVEYYFQCLTPGGHDSGWQDGSTYTDTGLGYDTSYTYQVKARDKSINQNETAYSEPLSATTPLYDCTAELDSDLDSDCQVNFLDYVIFADAWATQSSLGDIDGDTDVDFFDFAQLASEWLLCNRDPATACWQ